MFNRFQRTPLSELIVLKKAKAIIRLKIQQIVSSINLKTLSNSLIGFSLVKNQSKGWGLFEVWRNSGYEYQMYQCTSTAINVLSYFRPALPF